MLVSDTGIIVASAIWAAALVLIMLIAAAIAVPIGLYIGHTGRLANLAINTSNSRFWEPAVKRYVDECLAGRIGPRGADFQTGGVVADQVGKARLDIVVAALEGVIVGVADRGRVVLMIGDVVRGHGVGQARQFLDGFRLGQVGGSLHAPIKALRGTSSRVIASRDCR